MVYLFHNTMVSYLDLHVSRYHGIYLGLPVSKHHGILPWFTCFKTSWYFTMVFTLVYLFVNTNVFYHGIRWYIFIRLGERTCVDGEEGDRVFGWGTDELGRRLC